MFHTIHDALPAAVCASLSDQNGALPFSPSEHVGSAFSLFLCLARSERWGSIQACAGFTWWSRRRFRNHHFALTCDVIQIIRYFDAFAQFGNLVKLHLITVF